MLDWNAEFERGLDYETFLRQYATPTQRQRWDDVHRAVELSADQQALLTGFRREMRVVCLAGAWCGDCIEQCPIFAHIERVAPVVSVRYCDRDAHQDLADALSICGGRRVPVVLFLSEDGHEVARYGDRTLARYRRLAAQLVGAACPTGLVVPADDELGATTAEWLEQFERAQLILRTSPRLRERYGD